jgi:predicted MFS family arabinose efflux permease
MGMIFVPLFDIILSEVRDHEVGSASGMLESLQQLGAALGVAVLGTVFFSHLDVGVERVTLITFGLTAVTFALGFLLPRKARA